MIIDIKDFLLSNDVTIYCNDTKRHMLVDEAFELGGEFVVYKDGNSFDDLYRGDSFEDAMKVLYNKQ